MVTTVLVAGASGGTGRQILRALANTDYTVRALTRSESKESRLRELGADEVVVGDLLDAATASNAVKGCDAVLCAVGTPPGIADFLGEEVVDGEGVVNLVNAAVAADVERFVLESSIGVGDSREMMPAPLRFVLYRRLVAKNHAEAWLRSSGIDYTIVRPGGLTDDPPTDEVFVGEGGTTVSGRISRADVARLMVAALDTPESTNRTFEVVARDGSRGSSRGLVDIDWQRPPMPEVGEFDTSGDEFAASASEPVTIEVTEAEETDDADEPADAGGDDL